MTDFTINVLNNFTYIATVLAIILGCVLVLLLLVGLIWWILITIYKLSKGSVYFIHFLTHKKKFIKWYKENKPSKVYSPKLKEEEN